jgi:glutaredoxin
MFKIYGKSGCGFCERAKMLLDMKSEKYEYFDISNDAEKQSEFKSKGWRTVPQIFKDSERIGGYNELKNLFGN